MPTPTLDQIRELLAPREPPCLSLLQPTHRIHPDSRQDPIRYRNLLGTLEQQLAERFPEAPRHELLAPFRELGDDAGFWNASLDGLAIYGARGLFRVLRVQRPLPELALVGESFHAKPLLRVVQSAQRFQVLALTRGGIRLYEGDRYALDEVPLAEGVPATLEEALGSEITEPYLKAASYNQAGGSGGPAIFHGHGDNRDEVDLDAERWFRAVDRSILEHHSRPSGLPLLLAALPEQHDAFRRLSRNPFLAERGVRVGPGSLSTDELRAAAWEALEPAWRERLARLTDEFAAARARQRGSEDLRDVAQAAIQGRIDKLVVDADREVRGRLDAETGRIELASDEDAAGLDDLLDDLAEKALQTGSEVLVVPSERMPSPTGIAAIYRY